MFGFDPAILCLWPRPAPTGPAAPLPTPIILPTYASIATFGDSITVGVNAADAAHRWANLIAGITSATLLNAGISGTVLQNSADRSGSARASNARDRFATEVLGSNKKAAIFVAYGFNDARYTGAPTTFNVAQYQNDYQELLNGLILGGYAPTDIYIGSPYYITDAGLTSGTTGFTGQSRAGFEAFIAAAASVAAEFGTRYCDLYAYLRDNGFAATIDPADDIHPLNAGHALIAAAWQTQTIAANTRAAPATVTVAGGAGVATATASAVAGAASYEYALVANPANIATNTSGSFAGVAPGSCYAKARAVFSDGSKGPWAFSPNAAAVTGALGMFVSDSFTDASGTLMTAHAPETGGAWQLQTGDSTSATPRIDSAGRLYCAGTGMVFRNLGTPGNADYYVEADLVYLSAVSGMTAGVAGRMQGSAQTYYWARYNLSGAAWQVYKMLAGTATLLGSTTAPTFAAGQTKKLRLTVSGTTISAQVDGTTVISVTDTDITAAGYSGMRSATAVADTTGIHLDNFKAETL